MACARLGSACGSDYTVAGGVLGLVLSGGARLVSDSGWLEEGLAPDDLVNADGNGIYGCRLLPWRCLRGARCSSCLMAEISE